MGESGQCTLVRSCATFSAATSTQNTEALLYPNSSYCGRDALGEVLICCVTHARVSAAPPQKRFKTTTVSTIYRAVNTQLPDRTECGRRISKSRIKSGNIAEIGEFPWMALLRYSYMDGSDAGIRCGGTLINNRYVLTAAHCIKNLLDNAFITSVRFGEWKTSTDPDCVDEDINVHCAAPFEEVQVEQTISHTFFSGTTMTNDIALIRLNRNVKYTDYIRPICLSPDDYDAPPHESILTSCGWGKTENASSSDILMKVNLRLVNSTYCSKKINFGSKIITPNHICAGGEKDIDTCQGDSGGPLMRPYADTASNDRQWYQEGIVSYGRDCGQQGIPGVYTRVPRYITWIKNHLRR